MWGKVCGVMGMYRARNASANVIDGVGDAEGIQRCFVWDDGAKDAAAFRGPGG